MTYAASPTRRRRSTKAEMQTFRTELHHLVAEDWPMTVRHSFYRAVATGLVDKTEAEYGRVQRQLVAMRRDWWNLKKFRENAFDVLGMMLGSDSRETDVLDWLTTPGGAERARTTVPFDWIADNTRWTRKPTTFDSMEAALKNTAETYRRALWNDADEYVEVWCESDSIAGVIYDETDEWDVPLQVVRGMSSISYLYAAAQNIVETGKPAHLYYFGDYDKTGMDIDRNVEKDIREFAGDAEIYFERVAITSEQIEELNLPTKPSAKHRDFPNTVELEAIPPATLRRLVRGCIEQHVDPDLLAGIEVAEASEREVLTEIYETARGAA